MSNLRIESLWLNLWCLEMEMMGLSLDRIRINLNKHCFPKIISQHKNVEAYKLNDFQTSIRDLRFK